MTKGARGQGAGGKGETEGKSESGKAKAPDLDSLYKLPLSEFTGRATRSRGGSRKPGRPTTPAA